MRAASSPATSRWRRRNNWRRNCKFGSLPVPLRIESTRQVGATLGEQSIEASIRAGIIGVIVVLLFMLIYYRLPGVLADVALIIYVLTELCACSAPWA